MGKMVEMKLNIGCGKSVVPEFDGVDIKDFGQRFVCSALELPIENNTVDEIFSSHFLEHLNSEERIQFFNEIYRVMKNRAFAIIITPHFSHASAFGDPTHKYPPISEWYGYYLNKAFRDRYAPHLTDLDCDFDFTFSIQDVKVDGFEIKNLIVRLIK